MEECFYIKDSNLISPGKVLIIKKVRQVQDLNLNKGYKFVYENQKNQITGIKLFVD